MHTGFASHSEPASPDSGHGQRERPTARARSGQGAFQDPPGPLPRPPPRGAPPRTCPRPRPQALPTHPPHTGSASQWPGSYKLHRPRAQGEKLEVARASAEVVGRGSWERARQAAGGRTTESRVAVGVPEPEQEPEPESAARPPVTARAPGAARASGAARPWSPAAR